MIRVLCILIALATPATAVDVGEVLDDIVLEKRARSISAGLRCLQCRNESIDESNADIARDLRLLVRERLVAGDTDTEVVDFIVARYGEYVLLRPNGRGMNLVLWGAGPALLLLTLLGLGWAARRQGASDVTIPPLSSEEEAKLQRLLSGRDDP
ncbi:MAG: cytochrome c-type biogenesis protein [Pseudomonadota bacterium]